MTRPKLSFAGRSVAKPVFVRGDKPVNLILRQVVGHLFLSLKYFWNGFLGRIHLFSLSTEQYP